MRAAIDALGFRQRIIPRSKASQLGEPVEWIWLLFGAIVFGSAAALIAPQKELSIGT